MLDKLSEGLNPILDDEGTVIGAVGVYRDVTAEREEEQREASRREFIFQMLDSLTEPLAALNILTDEEYLNTAARELGIPGPGSDLPMPFTSPDGSRLDDNLLFEAMTGGPQELFEMVHHSFHGLERILEHKNLIVDLGGNRAKLVGNRGEIVEDRLEVLRNLRHVLLDGRNETICFHERHDQVDA